MTLQTKVDEFKDKVAQFQSLTAKFLKKQFGRGTKSETNKFLEEHLGEDFADLFSLVGRRIVFDSFDPSHTSGIDPEVAAAEDRDRWRPAGYGSTPEENEKILEAISTHFNIPKEGLDRVKDWDSVFRKDSYFGEILAVKCFDDLHVYHGLGGIVHEIYLKTTFGNLLYKFNLKEGEAVPPNEFDHPWSLIKNDGVTVVATGDIYIK